MPPSPCFTLQPAHTGEHDDCSPLKADERAPKGRIGLHLVVLALAVINKSRRPFRALSQSPISHRLHRQQRTGALASLAYSLEFPFFLLSAVHFVKVKTPFVELISTFPIKFHLQLFQAQCTRTCLLFWHWLPRNCLLFLTERPGRRVEA